MRGCAVQGMAEISEAGAGIHVMGFFLHFWSHPLQRREWGLRVVKQGPGPSPPAPADLRSREQLFFSATGGADNNIAACWVPWEVCLHACQTLRVVSC